MNLIIFLRKVWQMLFLEHRLPWRIEQGLLTIKQGVRPRLRAWSILYDSQFMRLKLLFSKSLSSKEKQMLRRVSLRVHQNDTLYETVTSSKWSHLLSESHYLMVGVSAIRCIESALQKSEGTVQSILDFPSGYGRVLRFLRVRFPDAEIAACEVEDAAVDFCGAAFNVKSVLSNIDFNKVLLSGTFSLIWCGSLITHIDENATIVLLKLFYRHLAPGGVCVFTTHGRRSAQWIEQGKQTYDLSAIAQKKILSEFYEEGYGFANYENLSGYGISVVSHDRMSAVAKSVGHWQECFFMERGWTDHQDVYGFSIPISLTA
jgi:SAM-dependent methyltransferase